MSHYEFEERISVPKLLILLSNFDVIYKKGYLFQHDPKNEYRQITDYMTCKNMLFHFLDLHDEEGKATVKYEALKHHPKGRLWAKQVSTQGISRYIRHTVCDDFMVDLDMKNAHPIFLQRICQQHNLRHDNLTHYINNREIILESIVDCGVCITKEDAKRLVLQIMNGGSSLSGEWNEWLGQFYFEIRAILQQCKHLFPHEYKIAIQNKGKDYYNLNGSCLNLVLTSMERTCLDKMINYCQFKNIQIGSLCHDGLMLIRKPDVDYHQLAINLSEHCGIQIIVKEMTQKIPTDDLTFTTLDYPYRSFSKELIRDARHILSSNFNSFGQADLFNKINLQYLHKWVYSRGKRERDGTWFEKQYNGRWFETQSPFKLSVEIAIHYPLLIQKVIDMVQNELKKNPDSDKKKKLEGELATLLKQKLKIQDLTGRRSLINELQISYNDDYFLEKIDSDRLLIGFENGVFDVGIGKFRPIGPQDFIQKSTQYDFPIKSDPKNREILLTMLKSMFVPSIALERSLTSEGLLMGEITDEMKRMDEEGEKDFLFCMIALASTLEGGNRFQKFYVMIGDGANGKSVLVKAIKSVFGDYACNIDISAFTQKKSSNNSHSDMPRTKGCHLLFTNESETTDRLNASQLKNITGDEEITEREMYKTTITFRPMFVPFLLTNNPPRINMDDAVARRIQMINFPFRFFSSEDEIGFNPTMKNKTHFLGKDPLFADKLIELRGELFLYLTEIYYSHVKNVDVLNPPERHVKATNSYFQEQDTFKEYIYTYFEPCDKNVPQISGPVLLQHVKTHYDDGMSAQRLKIAMEKLGLPAYDPPNKRRVYPIQEISRNSRFLSEETTDD